MVEATCGLRNSEILISDNLTPQETTNQMAPEMDTDGAGLSCPGNSVVAEALELYLAGPNSLPSLKWIVQSHKKIDAITAIGNIESTDDIWFCEHS